MYYDKTPIENQKCPCIEKVFSKVRLSDHIERGIRFENICKVELIGKKLETVTDGFYKYVYIFIEYFSKYVLTCHYGDTDTKVGPMKKHGFVED